MTEKKPLADPRNRVVATFAALSDANAAREALLQANLDVEAIRLFHGESAAQQVDTSAKWFADTDVEIERFKRALSDGQAVLSVPVESREQRDQVMAALTAHQAAAITHFGQWVTETIGPDSHGSTA